MAAHGDSGHAQWPVALPLQPVEQHGRLQDECRPHNEQVGHVLQTGASFKEQTNAKHRRATRMNTEAGNDDMSNLSVHAYK